MSYLYHTKGVYTCNGRHFFNKLESILESNVSGQHIGWDYHDNIFGQARWDLDPPVELEELYLQRALQLREAYEELTAVYDAMRRMVERGYLTFTAPAP